MDSRLRRNDMRKSAWAKSTTLPEKMAGMARATRREIVGVMLFHGFRSPAAHCARGYAYSTATRSEDGFAIAALRFASCPTFAGMTGREQDGRWIRVCAGMTCESPRGLRAPPYLKDSIFSVQIFFRRWIDTDKHGRTRTDTDRINGRHGPHYFLSGLRLLTPSGGY